MSSIQRVDVHLAVTRCLIWEKSMVWDEPDQNFLVVVNVEGQYSIWPDFKDIPEGWEKEGFLGKKEDCLQHIDQVWKDMRPRSLRLAMGQHDAADSAA